MDCDLIIKVEKDKQIDTKRILLVAEDLKWKTAIKLKSNKNKF